ncbi:hypothetical protein BDV96DRAFT_644867 [Lophiotrema nucula]|uniref:Uncharacterized protein n=1 Tax=Lophiotrema nucula TaxID=690887 RepID=A0A6A5ZD52_9PLEO|nr:hypothetical protein BDV96DRAFT_644867 [Lophiotrema nucula]
MHEYEGGGPTDSALRRRIFSAASSIDILNILTTEARTRQTAMAIANVAQICKTAFGHLLDDQCKYDDQAELSEAIEDEYARFNTWAAHIGVFAGPHSSLDYRLRESERVQSLVLAQLEILYTSQLRIINLTRPGRAPLDLPSKLPLKESHYAESLPESEDLSESDFYDSASERSDDRTQEDAVESIQNAVDRLHRLAKAIRRPGLVSQASKANKFKPLNEYGEDAIQVFERVSFEIIQAKHRGASDQILHRLSKSNAARRRLFLFRRKHQEVLSGTSGQAATKRPSLTRKETQGSGTIVPGTEQTSMPSHSTAAVSRVTKRSQVDSSVARASMFDESAFRPENSSKAPSSFAGTSVASLLAKARLPPPPHVKVVGNEFECPYCCQLISSKMLERRNWRQHLIKDLEPYVCLFNDCPQADIRYRDQNTWMTHLRTHTMRWICRLPGHTKGQNAQSFDSAEEYAEHLKTQHSTSKSLKQTQIEQLMKHQRPVQDPITFRICPLCPTKIEDFGSSATVATSSRTTGNMPASAAGQKMQKHILSHLQLIASYSLPWLDDVDGDVSSDRAPSLTSGDSDITDPGDEHVAEVSKSSDVLSEESVELIFDNPDIISEDKVDDEWTFIPRKEYKPQEFDETLSSFVRKYHIEMAFAENTTLEPNLPCICMPLDRNPEFFNRTDTLATLQAHLLGEDLSPPGLRTFALYGPAGIGKTQVATEWTYRNCHNFDAVFWVHADEAAKIGEDINRIVLQLGLVDEESVDSGDQALTKELFRRWLGEPAKSFKTPSNPAKAKWLLVLDHVIDPALLDDIWPTTRNYGSILITSRRHMPWDPSKYPSKIVQPFTPQNGAEMMCKLFPHNVSSEERQCAYQISSKERGMPYALIHIAKWILGEKLTFGDFLLQDSTRETNKEERKTKGAHVRFAVDESHSFLDSAFESIQRSRALLDVLSMLDPDTIPKKILRAKGDYLTIEGFPATETELDGALEELLKFDLLKESQTNAATYFMPRIVQEAVRKQMTPLYSRCVFDTCVLILCAQWPFQNFTWRHGTSRWPQCEELFPHIMRLRRIAPSIKTNEYDPYCGFQYARLWCDCGWYCHERGRIGEADVFSGLAQNICIELKKHLPSKVSGQGSKLPTVRAVDETLAEIIHNRGVIAVEVHKPVESLNYLLEFNRMMTAELGHKAGGTDMRLALSFNELGCAYMLHEDYLHAEDCFRNSIARMRMLDNYEPWQVSLPGVNLGTVFHFTGRLDEAHEILSQGLRDRERKFGYNDRESFITGRYLYTLGNVHDEMPEYNDSLEYHQRALNHYRSTLGSGHHRTADSLVRIGRHFMKMGQMDEALDLVDRAIQIYGFDIAFKAELARARFWKSRVLRAGSRIEEADAEYSASVTMYRELEGKVDTKDESDNPDESDFDSRVTFWSR